MEDLEEDLDTRTLVQSHNRKNKKSGGFQSMGLSREVFRGILKKGYKVPTPIQRKTIPLILEGRDLVGMARTGSGKTGAFLIPMLEKLISKRGNARGPRALILSPTRELALQTMRFLKELGKFLEIRCMTVLGGESMEKQFSGIHDNPDVLVATPGRFVHLCVEMNLRLDGINYVVFDEADRLFELGFGDQLKEIMGRLPDNRQTLLFSATLPKLLVEFAKAGLNDPTLIRLDVDSKIPETLRLAFVSCRDECKPAVLLYTLENVISEGAQTIVFCATRHHVEYIHVLLELARIPSTFIYSQLDPSARKINTAKFVTRKVPVLLVTDLAARGIDIPLLDYVINYNFPAKSKLFIHRVGRVARAGRKGTAISFVAGDELAYMMDLQLFLGNPFTLVQKDGDWHNALGQSPQFVQDEYADQLKSLYDLSLDLTNLKKVSENGYIQYLKSRPGASAESVKRGKELKEKAVLPHPLYTSKEHQQSEETFNFLENMKKFRPKSTIFEIGNSAKSSNIKSIMVGKRLKDEEIVEKFRSKKENNHEINEETLNNLEESSQRDIDSAFEKVIASKKARDIKRSVKKRKDYALNHGRRIHKDEENYIGYRPKDHHSEAGYSLMSGFEAQAANAVLDLDGDDNGSLRRKKVLMRWDVKTKKYVRDLDDKKKIKTESGVWIPASYKSNRYKKWKERSKVDLFNADEEEIENGKNEGGKSKKRRNQTLPDHHPAVKRAKGSNSKSRRGPKSEIKRPEQILKQRALNDKKRFKNTKRKK